MQVLYNTLIALAQIFLPILGVFNPKIKDFIKGRKQSFEKLQQAIKPSDKTLWMHCASLGEFEQGRPIIEALIKQFPQYKIIISFFSPSGYEIQKEYKMADVVVYLPLDTPTNAQEFIRLTHPSLAIFVKYEFWPNLLQEIRHQKIKTILVSGIFRKNQHFFKKNNHWFKKSLQSFSHFFVQNEESVSLLNSIGYTKVTQNGDTRFDRVFEILQNKKTLPLVEVFTKNRFTVVAGSTWPEDEKLLIEYINTKATPDDRFIFAPHTIDSSGLERLQTNLTKQNVLYSQANSTNVTEAQVLIIDSIGILTQIYAYADIAYVGGGFGKGIHNILEPATYGIPILIGPNYTKFQEAKDLIALKGCFKIDSYKQLEKLLISLKSDSKFRATSGNISFNYIKQNTGATKKIIEYVTKVL